ncbi:MAG: M20/M25/M40 family metallo-hydrolase [Candidatus Aminicenantes bacterium]|nr:M20/M25/M40 family metallo-hydrolase [Candidatus Aminicenantes bacterium]
MNRKRLPLVFFSMIICVTAFQSVYPQQPIQYILKIDKTGKTADILLKHKEIKIYQELNSCYLGVTEEKNVPGLKALAIPYKVLDKISGSTGIMDGAFLVHLRDISYLSILKQNGTAISVEGNNVLFLPSGSQHPRKMLPNIFRGIKKLGAPVKIGAIPLSLSPDHISVLKAIKQIDPLISAMVSAVSKNNLKTNIQTLQNFVTRDATTDECEEAGDFIAAALLQSGVQVEEDPFNFEGYSSRNIVGYLPGVTDPSSIVIIGAHYDSYADPDSRESAPGADDNAGGTAAVLEAARIMSQYSFAHSIKFILFSAEEWGLYGSDHYARQAAGRENIVGVINLDMIAYTDHLPEDLDVIVNLNSKWLGNLLKTAAQNYSSIDVLTTLDNWADYSDHYSFWDRGFPAVLCIEDYEDTNPYYHTTGDTIDTINLDFAAEAARVCLAAAAQLAEPDESLVSTITVTSPNGGETWTVGNSYPITWTTSGAVGNVNIKYSTNNGSSWTTLISSTDNDGSYTWTVPNAVSTQCKIKISGAADSDPSDTSNEAFTIEAGLSPAIGLNRTLLYFGGLETGIHTGAQEVWIHNSGGGTLNWQTGDNAAWLTCAPASGTNNGIITVSIDPGGLAAGTYTGIISITGTNASNSPQTVSVTLTIKPVSQDMPPFGDFATPLDNAAVSSSFAVTGWALDDTGIESVKIYREAGTSLVFIGDAVFINGARPDVETAYPNYPYKYKTGWGYMLLSYFLPDGGNGVYKLHAIAADASGNSATLGVKTITVDNNHSVKPFGTIDAPAQGGLVSSSSYINWGWVLTPQPNHIAANGSTVNVWVDGVNKGHPTYNIYRSDIASLFPGYANSNGAIGYFSLDTGALENGLHTIQWSASDSAGNADGIGSRYFLINNSAGDLKQDARFKANPLIKDMMQIDNIPINPGPVWLKQGYDDNDFLRAVYTGETGRCTIRVNELERIQIHLDDPMANRSLSGFSGYMIVNNRMESLPVGSTFDSRKGIFYWQPGPGFVGQYRFVFILKEETGQMNRKEIVVRIN